MHFHETGKQIQDRHFLRIPISSALPNLIKETITQIVISKRENALDELA